MLLRTMGATVGRYGFREATQRAPATERVEPHRQARSAVPSGDAAAGWPAAPLRSLDLKLADKIGGRTRSGPTETGMRAVRAVQKLHY